MWSLWTLATLSDPCSTRLCYFHLLFYIQTHTIHFLSVLPFCSHLAPLLSVAFCSAWIDFPGSVDLRFEMCVICRQWGIQLQQRHSFSWCAGPPNTQRHTVSLNAALIFLLGAMCAYWNRLTWCLHFLKKNHVFVLRYGSLHTHCNRLLGDVLTLNLTKGQPRGLKN